MCIRDRLHKTLDGLEARVARILRLHEREVSSIYSTHYNMMRKEIEDLKLELKTKLEARPEHGMDQEALITNLRNIIKKIDEENGAGHKLIMQQAGQIKDFHKQCEVLKEELRTSNVLVKKIYNKYAKLARAQGLSDTFEMLELSVDMESGNDLSMMSNTGSNQYSPLKTIKNSNDNTHNANSDGEISLGEMREIRQDSKGKFRGGTRMNGDSMNYFMTDSEDEAGHARGGNVTQRMMMVGGSPQLNGRRRRFESKIPLNFDLTVLMEKVQDLIVSCYTGAEGVLEKFVERLTEEIVTILKAKEYEIVVLNQKNESLRRNHAMKRAENLKEALSDVRYQEVFISCVEQVRREVERRNGAMREQSQGKMTEAFKQKLNEENFKNALQGTDKLRILELFIMNSDILGELHHKIFPKKGDPKLIDPLKETLTSHTNRRRKQAANDNVKDGERSEILIEEREKSPRETEETVDSKMSSRLPMLNLTFTAGTESTARRRNVSVEISKVSGRRSPMVTHYIPKNERKPSLHARGNLALQGVLFGMLKEREDNDREERLKRGNHLVSSPLKASPS
eukprot:TRINITY_DN14340_c0_g1_i1.p1 TRINITY_DN14340_c0_g1~~TRINITY_DN14340_c0_g1_i1.p1  ORF type:complete len:568 (+),score=71.17 TRINITY_DN14340_c0_g1_i1:63-1766(+)